MIRRRRESLPVLADGDGFVVQLGADESALVRRLVDELRTLLTDVEPDSEARVLLVRLFPVAHADDPEAEAEYQRLMRDELVQSKLASFAIVDEVLASPGRIDEGRLIAFMQSINSIRLVLGTMLGVTDDPDLPEVNPGFEDTPEYHLYAWLSWLLDHIVHALSGGAG
ncbi:MAG: DUF2017 family protein [Ilumatobacter sp.]|nr:DUF2017 family protein [Ilumatobacter sp.]